MIVQWCEAAGGVNDTDLVDAHTTREVALFFPVRSVVPGCNGKRLTEVGKHDRPDFLWQTAGGGFGCRHGR